MRGVDPSGFIKIDCKCRPHGRHVHGPKTPFVWETIDIPSLSWLAIEKGCSDACKNRYRTKDGLWTKDWHREEDRPPTEVIDMISGHDYGRLRKMCLAISDPYLSSSTRNNTACGLCNVNICMNEIRKLMAGIPVTDKETTLLEATVFYQGIWGGIMGNDVHGGYCHAWWANFAKITDAIDRASCLKSITYQIGLNPLRNEGYSDHGFTVVKSNCSGTCMIIQNWPFPRIIDPCDWKWTRDDFSGTGAETWNSILTTCNCPNRDKV